MPQPYRSLLVKAFDAGIDWEGSRNIRASLHTASYTPVLDAHDAVDDLSNELPSAGGYTSGGLQLSSLSRAYTAANSWSQARAGGTGYALSKVVRPATGNGLLYQCVVAGTSGGSIPTFPTTLGERVADGSAVWLCAGRGVVVLDAADAAWTTATFTGARYLVLSDRTTAGAANQPLLGLHDYGSAQSGGGGTFTHTWENPEGVFYFLTP